MSLLSRSADLVYTFRFLRLLTTDWEDLKAFELGIIDADGKRIKSKSVTTSEEKSAYNAFHRMVFSLKRLLNKVPGGRSRIASYAAALFLIREHTGMSEKGIEKLVEEMGIDVLDITEHSSQWYVVEDDQGYMLSPGVYKLRDDKLLNSSCEPLAYASDRVRVEEDCRPVGQMFGMDIYEVIHQNTNQSVYVTAGDLIK